MRNIDLILELDSFNDDTEIKVVVKNPDTGVYHPYEITDFLFHNDEILLKCEKPL